MAFVTAKEELKPGLILFRRGDVGHLNWYCRIKLPKADRYKTISLKTADTSVARQAALDHYAEVRLRLKYGVPVFNPLLRDVGKKYLTLQKQRAERGEITEARVGKLRAVILGPLDAYVGSTQMHLVGQDSWAGYPSHRRHTGKGRYGDKLIRDSTIHFELSIFRAIIAYAIGKGYVSASERVEGRLKLTKVRRDAFTLEEYHHLLAEGRRWIVEVPRDESRWYRAVVLNFIMIMTSTGMRPSEARNLRWRDITSATDNDGREIVVMRVHGKEKSRALVAPAYVREYLDQVREISAATGSDDPVFTTRDGRAAQSLYRVLIRSLLAQAGLGGGSNGPPRSTYSFRHTYATLRLGEGVETLFLAKQMGTSIKMIEEHYGHTNTIRHADLILRGMGDWGPPELAPLAPGLSNPIERLGVLEEQAASGPTRERLIAHG